MSASITIIPKGLSRVLGSLKSFPDNLKREVNMEFSAAALNVERVAKRKVATNKSVDEGRLLNSIKGGKEGEKHTVTVGLYYAPFVEFGTKKHFKATRGFENYAKQFKGATGNVGGETLFDSILGWVKRKKIRFEKAVSTINYKTGRAKKPSAKTRYLTTEQTAFIIAQHIAFRGTKPHPFLLPAFVEERRLVVKAIIQAIRRAFK